MRISYTKSFNIPVSIAFATLVHMINVYEICLNTTNYPILNMQVDLHFETVLVSWYPHHDQFTWLQYKNWHSTNNTPLFQPSFPVKVSTQTSCGHIFPLSLKCYIVQSIYSICYIIILWFKIDSMAFLIKFE